MNDSSVVILILAAEYLAFSAFGLYAIPWGKSATTGDESA